ncbi:glyoxylase-like metal-dependent hydrolase (beta-lactamase superfamily II) [Arthrobacter woluwensis]|uniref:MBL fold metallo-hydrolase n=1 Tax=Arthrobacter woluwensis TaxID=156980 RepID=UPI002782FEBE|nr:MBL fold metallo-hydrolase [Arthrobacter woluwensis]MDQ0709209.1 glyoxylase-like metal-dependent hydrolase (beta-lactamase superfamily II) [Arthrobacter woluwensis]
MPDTTPDAVPPVSEPRAGDSAAELLPGVLSDAGSGLRVLLAPNPGPMSLRGTHSYVIGPDGSCVIVDPGPEDEGHLAALAALRPVLILVTHRHADHTAGIDRLRTLTGAPVRAASSAFCRDAEPLADGEILAVGDLEIRVLATPGHTSDSLCFHVLGKQASCVGGGPDGGSLLSGDTILGTGTTMLDHPDGTVADYLASLGKLAALAEDAGAPVTLLPAHGGLGGDLGVVVREYREHRLARLAEVRRAVTAVGDDVDAVTAAVYPDVSDGVRRAARLSIEAQLRYLRESRDA